MLQPCGSSPAVKVPRGHPPRIVFELAAKTLPIIIIMSAPWMGSMVNAKAGKIYLLGLKIQIITYRMKICKYFTSVYYYAYQARPWKNYINTNILMNVVNIL